MYIEVSTIVIKCVKPPSKHNVTPKVYTDIRLYIMIHDPFWCQVLRMDYWQWLEWSQSIDETSLHEKLETERCRTFLKMQFWGKRGSIGNICLNLGRAHLWSGAKRQFYYKSLCDVWVHLLIEIYTISRPVELFYSLIIIAFV